MIDRYLLYMGQRAERALYNDVLDYVSYLRKTKCHPKTIKNNLFAVKIYYHYLISTGKRKDHPCIDLNLQDKIDRSIAVEELYKPKELEELLEKSKTRKSSLHERNKVIISLLIYQALTVLEISQLNTNDINLEAGTINIKGNVKNNGRTLNLRTNQIMLLHRYITESRPKLTLRQAQGKVNKETEALITSTTGKRIDPHSISCQINNSLGKYKRITPIKIRQSVIANLLKSGNDIRVVQVFAGHKRASSTEAYRRSGLDELKSAINRLHPLQ